MRLIDADLAVAKCNEDIVAVKDISQRVDGILDAVMNIHECPTIDAVPVVRCRDCKECEIDDIFHDYWCNGRKVWKDHYCSFGKRRTDE